MFLKPFSAAGCVEIECTTKHVSCFTCRRRVSFLPSVSDMYLGFRRRSVNRPLLRGGERAISQRAVKQKPQSPQQRRSLLQMSKLMVWYSNAPVCGVKYPVVIIGQPLPPITDTCYFPDHINCCHQTRYSSCKLVVRLLAFARLQTKIAHCPCKDQGALRNQPSTTLNRSLQMTVKYNSFSSYYLKAKVRHGLLAADGAPLGFHCF